MAMYVLNINIYIHSHTHIYTYMYNICSTKFLKSKQNILLHQTPNEGFQNFSPLGNRTFILEKRLRYFWSSSSTPSWSSWLPCSPGSTDSLLPGDRSKDSLRSVVPPAPEAIWDTLRSSARCLKPFAAIS